MSRAKPPVFVEFLADAHQRAGKRSVASSPRLNRFDRDSGCERPCVARASKRFVREAVDESPNLIANFAHLT